MLDRLAVPGPRTLLAAILVGRLILVALALGRILGGPVGIDTLLVVLLQMVAIAAVAATAWLAWQLRRGRPLPGPSALLVQAAIDVLVVTGQVVFGQGQATPVAALYLALVAVYGLLLPVGRALLAIVLAGVCYVAVTYLAMSTGPEPDFWLQVAVITGVGALIAVLGHRLAGVSREQRVLTEALAQARLEADEILSTIQSGVISVDADGRLGYLNPRGRRILGGDGFVPGEPVMETLRARSRELHEAIQRGLSDGVRVARGEAAVRRPDGSLFPVGLSTTTFQRPGSDRPLVTAIFTDISDLKRLQEFRLRAERLEAVAALSAGLAHEIRNPLAAIRSAVEQLARSVGQDEDDQTLVRLAMRESERLNRLLSEFLDFSRVRATKFERLDLRALAEDAVRVLREHPATRGVTLTVQGDPLELEADEDLLHRVVSNLVLNAAQALDGRGTITVATERVEPRGVGAVERPIRLQVIDDGPGIPEPVRERLFEPFVSGRTGGSGLGLAIVQRAVAAHRGIILVDTAAGAGTTFSIFLPATWDREDGA